MFLKTSSWKNALFFDTLETCALGLLAYSVRRFSSQILQHMKLPILVYTPSTRPAIWILSDTNQKRFVLLQLEGVTSVVSCVKIWVPIPVIKYDDPPPWVAENWMTQWIQRRLKRWVLMFLSCNVMPKWSSGRVAKSPFQAAPGLLTAKAPNTITCAAAKQTMLSGVPILFRGAKKRNREAWLQVSYFKELRPSIQCFVHLRSYHLR